MVWYFSITPPNETVSLNSNFERNQRYLTPKPKTLEPSKRKWPDGTLGEKASKTGSKRLMWLLFLTVICSGCTKTPSMLKSPILIQPNWVKASRPSKLYSKDFVGPYSCNNPVAKCISNADLQEELLVKAKLIVTIEEMLEAIQTHNSRD